GVYPVLENVNLQVEAGEFVTVVGHSGCGKSTLLNMVAGFNTPSSGQVLLQGQPITAPGPDRMVVFQGYALLPWLTVFENVYLGVDAVLKQETVAAKKQIVWEHLALVGLTEAAEKYPPQISGGMKQR
ncbi:MAG: ATP-binding cassette domain-containing protein, partial [Thermostichales cyanobacterium SRBZ-1_bins_19]